MRIKIKNAESEISLKFKSNEELIKTRNLILDCIMDNANKHYVTYINNSGDVMIMPRKFLKESLITIDTKEYFVDNVC